MAHQKHPLPGRILSAILLSFASAISLNAQNLVPNPSFEELLQTPCNCMQSDIPDYVKNWNSAGSGTPDVITDQASADCYASTNSSHWDSYGHQQPHSGHAMGMIMTSAHNDTYREYLGTELKTPLQAGKKYYTEMYVSLGDYAGLATNNIGMCFYTGTFTRKSETILLDQPQVNYSEIVNNKDGWVKITGSFIAHDDYTYMVIGNFFSKEETKTEAQEKLATYPGKHSYRESIAAYFIDDITVRPAPQLTVWGDSVVVEGSIATVNAKGSLNYAWADTAHPGTILARSAQYKPVMYQKKTFYVYGDEDTAMITVDVTKPTVLKELNGRKIKKGRTIEVTSTTITITVYDNNKIDGDSIALYYGDSCIVQHCKLTKKKQKFVVKIDPDHPRQIILYAENVGTTPPNTASVAVSDGKNDTNIVLSSDMKTCDSVTLIYAPKGGGK